MTFRPKLPRRAALLAVALAAAALPAAATPIDFHPNENLLPMRLFAHDGDVLVVWGNRHLSVVASESLAVAELDQADHYLVPMPVPGSGAFFYARLGPWPDELRALHGREPVALAEAIDPGTFAAAGGHLFFTTFATGMDVRASDGTPAGTGLLFDPDPDWVPGCPILCPPSYTSPFRLHAAPNGRIYALTADDPGLQLFTRDPAAEFPGLPPTPAPASRALAFLDSEPVFSFVLQDGRLFFFRNPPVGIGPQLWVSDGSVAGTVPLKTFPEIAGGAYAPIHHPVEMGGRLYFLAEASASRQLWRSDGSAAGTVLVRDFGLGTPIADLWVHGDHLYLPLEASGLGEELWVSDGSGDGTRLFADIGQGFLGARPRAFAPLPDGRFVVSLDDGTHGAEPWISDGTAAGTRLIADAVPGGLGSEPADFVFASGRLFFAGSNGQGRRTPSYVPLELVTPEPACPGDRLCLLGGRFEVETFFTTGPDSGKGRRAVASEQTGIFSFFSPDNWEVMVKVLDGCGLNDRFWVFASAATDVRYELRVTDTATGVVRTYQHGGGGPAPAITDIDAFATCLGADLGKALP